MCSIFGIGFYKGHGMNNEATITGIVSRLFKEAEVGGKRAAGLSVMREKTGHVMRRPLSGSQLAATGEYLDFMMDSLGKDSEDNKLLSIIGHCRWPTQGPPEENLNNHPQVCGNIIGVHNGVITNDHQLFKSFEKQITRQAEVDTEIIFQLIDHFADPSEPGIKTIDAIQKATPYLGGSYACGMQNTNHPYNLYLFRHSNPIQIRYYSELGVVLFATRMHFIKEAFDNFLEHTGPHEDIDLIENAGVVFNMWNRTMCKFHFKDKQQAEDVTNAVG
jgi:glucosamine 6-phosphate synthetase-like amidotransferase/phosphosugar isomerase protein